MKKASAKPPIGGGSRKGKKVVTSTKRSVKYPGGEERERVQEEIWFAENLKKIRISRGWEQKRMADLLKMTQPSYSNIEHHRRSLKLNTMSFIANKLKVPVYRLLMEPKESFFSE